MQPIVIAIVVATLALLAMFLMQSKKTAPSAPVALHQTEYRRFKLTKKVDVNHNTILLTFELPTPQHRVGLPIGKHMYLRFKNEKGEFVSRAYTPVSSDDDLGYFDLLIKLYPNGAMSQHLQKMQVGESIEARGPIGSLTYTGAGKFLIKRRDPATQVTEEQEQTVKRVGMIAGGSGITPMLQLIRAIAKQQQSDRTEVSLIFGNVTEADILLRSELDELSKQMKNLKVFYTLDKPAESWKGGRGFITADMIQNNLPAPGKDTLILLCGPKPMIENMQKNLHALDYQETQYFCY